MSFQNMMKEKKGMKNTKKIVAILLALLLCAALCACGKSAGAGLKTVESGKLHMSTNAAFPPYEMTTDNGGFEGIDVEIAGAIAKKLNLELVVDDMGFDAALLAVQNGQSDIVMAGVSVTEDRQKVMEFSDSYATGVQVVIVTRDSKIKTVDDLSAGGLRIGVQSSTTGDLYATWDLEDEGLATVQRYNKGADAVQALVTGKVDCVVIDNEPAKAFVAANPGLSILPTAYTEEDYAIAFAKGNTELQTKVNGALKELIADGTAAKIIDKYIGD